MFEARLYSCIEGIVLMRTGLKGKLDIINHFTKFTAEFCERGLARDLTAISLTDDKLHLTVLNLYLNYDAQRLTGRGQSLNLEDS